MFVSPTLNDPANTGSTDAQVSSVTQPGLPVSLRRSASPSFLAL